MPDYELGMADTITVRFPYRFMVGLTIMDGINPAIEGNGRSERVQGG